ncbi:hypothetical protein, partial [Xanthomonas hortorum]
SVAWITPQHEAGSVAYLWCVVQRFPNVVEGFSRDFAPWNLRRRNGPQEKARQLGGFQVLLERDQIRKTIPPAVSGSHLTLESLHQKSPLML